MVRLAIYFHMLGGKKDNIVCVAHKPAIYIHDELMNFLGFYFNEH